MMARFIHASLIVGVLLFAAVSHFVMRPAMSDQPLPAVVTVALLAASLVATALAVLVLRPRIPRRSADESADLYWAAAATPALLAWAPLEAAAIMALVAYMLGASLIALGVAAVALLGMIALNPGRLERA